MELLLVLLFVTLGAWIQGSVGIGQGMVAAPLVALIAPRFLPGPLLFCAMALVSMLVIRERRSLVFGQVGWALVGRVPGVVLGGCLLAWVAARWLDVTLGGLLLACVLMSASTLRLRPTRSALVAAGLVSGVTGTTASVGGPPIALVLQHEEGAKVRATLSGFFLVGTILSLAMLSTVGRYGRPEILDSLRLLPGVAVGFVLSGHTRGWLDRGRVRPAILWLSGTASALVLVRGLARLFA